ncbi:hypothetical protein BV22DRAFT_995065, partial [Leucogyrophana mollusca]
DGDREKIPEVKGAKPTTPDTYDGKDDIEMFESWLSKTLRWMRMLRMVGPNYDRLRIEYLGSTLTGLALSWYEQVIESPYGEGNHYYFNEVVVALFKRFITEATVQKAHDEYAA